MGRHQGDDEPLGATADGGVGAGAKSGRLMQYWYSIEAHLNTSDQCLILGALYKDSDFIIDRILLGGPDGRICTA